jgi:SAM-dependent methyltransferase
MVQQRDVEGGGSEPSRNGREGAAKNRALEPAEASRATLPEDYRARFYAQYHTAVGTSPLRPSEQELQRLTRQFGGRWDRWLPRDRRAPCLDLGCGAGGFLYYLRHRGFSDVGGTDLNEESLDVARSLGLANVRRADAAAYLAQVPSGSIGLISALNFFEHLTKSETLTLLPLVFDALAPGGRLVAITPNGLSPFGGATRYWDFSHETSFTPASWRQLARIAGFAEAHFEDYGPLPHSLPGVVRCALWRALSLGLTAASYVEVGSRRDQSGVFTADMKIILVKQ